jgi:glycosyltransferase involved in cell wall biosynthesis
MDKNPVSAMDNKKIVIWGVTSAYFTYKSQFNYDFEYFVDSDQNKHNTYIDNKVVLSPDILKHKENDRIFVVVFSDNHYDAIKETLEVYGFREFIDFCCFMDLIKTDYQEWMERYEPNEEDLAEQKILSQKLSFKPVISILVPTYETDRQMLVEMIDSVRNQTYPYWELCIADGNSQKPHVKKVLTDYSRFDSRIKVAFLNKNYGIIGNSNEAWKLCTGDYIGLLDHDDTLAPFALYEIAKRLNEEKADFIYSDEDKISIDSQRRFNPHFKPDWSPDTLRSYNYITHFIVLKASLMKEIEGFREGYEGSQDHDLILRATNKAKKIVHISKVLYHWRVHNLSVAGNMNCKPYAFESAKKAVLDQIITNNYVGSVEDGLFFAGYWVKYQFKDNPKVSLLITGDDGDFQPVLKSIYNQTDYPNFEVIVLNRDNFQSTKIEDYPSYRTLDYHEGWNELSLSQLADLTGNSKYLVFLRDNIEIIAPDWLQNMVEHARREEVGAVGCKILYKDNSIQHAGIVLGLKGGAAHVCENAIDFEIKYMFHCRNLVNAIRNVSAVSNECLTVNKEKFFKVGGFNPDSSESAIRFCLRLLTQGLVNVYTPYTELYYKKKLFEPVCHVYHDPEFAVQDPYYNCNFDPNSIIPKIRTGMENRDEN